MFNFCTKWDYAYLKMLRYHEYSIKSNPFGISPRPLPNTIQESRQRLRSSKLGDRSLRDRLTFARNMRELGALYSVVGLSREAIFSRGQSLQCCARFQVHRRAPIRPQHCRRLRGWCTVFRQFRQLRQLLASPVVFSQCINISADSLLGPQRDTQASTNRLHKWGFYPGLLFLMHGVVRLCGHGRDAWQMKRTEIPWTELSKRCYLWTVAALCEVNNVIK